MKYSEAVLNVELDHAELKNGEMSCVFEIED